MQLAEEIGIEHLEAYGNLKLFINQIRREYKVRHKNLVSYHNATVNMVEKFQNFYIDHVSQQ